MPKGSVELTNARKEEIFLEILKKEYLLWIEELQHIIDDNEKLSMEQFAKKIAQSLERREQLLKILSMNMYDMEENSRMENLTEFKKLYDMICQGRKFILFVLQAEVGLKQVYQTCKDYILM